MIFDQFAGVIERYYPNLKKDFKETIILILTKELMETMKEKEGKIEDLKDIILPYKTVIIENLDFAVMIKDTIENQSGFNEFREYIMCIPIKRDFYHLQFGRFQRTAIPNKGSNLTLFQEITKIEYVDKNKGIQMSIDGKKIKEDKNKETSSTLHAFQRNVIVCLYYVNLIGSKENILISEKPLKLPNNKNPNMIDRSQYRTIYRLTKLYEAVNRFTGSNHNKESFRTVSSHFRRRHYRNLTNDRFKRDETGAVKRVMVPACWIGNKELIEGNKKYEICLDM